MNRQQFFQEIMQEFQSKTIDMIEEVASKAVTEYLPHIESDTQWNAEHLAREIVQGLIVGERSYRTEGVVLSANAVKVRKAIFDQYRPELQQGIIKDLQEEIEHLKISLENAYRRY